MVQWLGLTLLLQGVWVRSLVRELRSYMLHGVANNNNNKCKRKSSFKNFQFQSTFPFKQIKTQITSSKKKKHKKTFKCKSPVCTSRKSDSLGLWVGLGILYFSKPPALHVAGMLGGGEQVKLEEQVS